MSVSTLKIVTIIGARPQFVKAATISRILQCNPRVDEVLVHTGQHYDHNISGVFFEEMDIPAPRHHLGIGSGLHGQQTGRMLEAIESVLVSERPDLVLVYGDTNSTLAGALAAAKLHIPIAHVEAGLRSFNRKMPEEINRVLTDHIGILLFAPTDAAMRNLRDEGIDEDLIVRSGDVMYDAARYYGAKADAKSRILEHLGIAPGQFILATVHRAENTDDPAHLDSIISALARVAESTPVILPLHPRTRRSVADSAHLSSSFKTLTVIDPVGYLDMIALEKHARLIVTDSGGVQKEASFHNVRCVTLRGETEWEELIAVRRNVLAPPEKGSIFIEQCIAESMLLPKLDSAEIYGDGHAAELIVRSILERSAASKQR